MISSEKCINDAEKSAEDELVGDSRSGLQLGKLSMHLNLFDVLTSLPSNCTRSCCRTNCQPIGADHYWIKYRTNPNRHPTQ
jgi:hypothetical protein